MSRLQVILLVVASIAFTSTGRSEVLDLRWPDLKGKTEQFEDPFTKLNNDQLFQLGMVARLRELQDRSDQPLSAANAAQLQQNTTLLIDAEIDIDYLLSRRAEITELRRQQAMAPRPDLDGKVVKMPGYLLPLDVTGGKVTEFLLVPWVGACIHTPPPPPNQIVYVQATEPWKVRSHWEAVFVEGTVQVGDVIKNLFLVDGSADIPIGYTMTSATVFSFETKK